MTDAKRNPAGKAVVVDYNEVCEAARNAPAAAGGQARSPFSTTMLSVLPFLGGPLVAGPFITGKLISLLVEELTNRPASPADFNEDDRDNITHMIEVGRRQGLEEMEIVVGKRRGDKMGLSAGLPIQGLPVKVDASVECTREGDYKIHVRYGAPGHPQDIEALERYHDLMKQGIITPAEYEAKKRKILGE